MFWEGFYKRAASMLKQVTQQARRRHSAPPIPGPRIIVGNPSTIPGQGAMIMGERGLKFAPQSIKSRGAGSTEVP